MAHDAVGKSTVARQAVDVQRLAAVCSFRRSREHVAQPACHTMSTPGRWLWPGQPCEAFSVVFILIIVGGVGRQGLTCLAHEEAGLCKVDLPHCQAAVACLLVAQAVDDGPRSFQEAGWRDCMQVLHLQHGTASFRLLHMHAAWSASCNSSFVGSPADSLELLRTVLSSLGIVLPDLVSCVLLLCIEDCYFACCETCSLLSGVYALLLQVQRGLWEVWSVTCTET